MKPSIARDEQMSFKDLYRMTGLLGMLLPVFIFLRLGGSFPPSISQSYYTPAREFFTITMGSLGLFFLTNKGYDIIDNICNKLAGSMAIVIPMFGCEGPYSWVHFSAAVLFFVILAVMCIFVFTTGYSGTAQKHKRNAVYRVCGLLILLGMVFTAITKQIATGEIIMLESFGFAYFVKGNALFRDSE